MSKENKILCEAFESLAKNADFDTAKALLTHFPKQIPLDSNTLTLCWYDAIRSETADKIHFLAGCGIDIADQSVYSQVIEENSFENMVAVYEHHPDWFHRGIKVNPNARELPKSPVDRAIVRNQPQKARFLIEKGIAMSDGYRLELEREAWLSSDAYHNDKAIETAQLAIELLNEKPESFVTDDDFLPKGFAQKVLLNMPELNLPLLRKFWSGEGKEWLLPIAQLLLRSDILVVAEEKGITVESPDIANIVEDFKDFSSLIRVSNKAFQNRPTDVLDQAPHGYINDNFLHLFDIAVETLKSKNCFNYYYEELMQNVITYVDKLNNPDLIDALLERFLSNIRDGDDDKNKKMREILYHEMNDLIAGLSDAGAALALEKLFELSDVPESAYTSPEFCGLVEMIPHYNVSVAEFSAAIRSGKIMNKIANKRIASPKTWVMRCTANFATGNAAYRMKTMPEFVSLFDPLTEAQWNDIKEFSGFDGKSIKAILGYARSNYNGNKSASAMEGLTLLSLLPESMRPQAIDAIAEKVQNLAADFPFQWLSCAWGKTPYDMMSEYDIKDKTRALLMANMS